MTKSDEFRKRLIKINTEAGALFKDMELSF